MIPKFFIRFSFRPPNVFAIWITSKLSVNFLWQLSTVKLLNCCCFMFDLSHVFRLKWSKTFLTMAVHCWSNVILLAIEYFIDSKGERQNIKLLSTQNNYSSSFGLRKLVIFFISSDKTDKKNSAEAGSTKHAAESNEAKGRPRHGVWSRGKSAPGHNYREKHRSITVKCLAFEIKENTENIAKYRRKKNLFQVFF